MSALSAREQGKLFFGKGKFSAAAEAYTEAINQDRENVGLYTNRALCNQKLGKWEESMIDATKAIELSSSSCKGHYLYAQACVNLGRYEAAVDYFRKALTLGETESPVYREGIEKALYSLLERLCKLQEEEDQILLSRDEAVIDGLLEEGERVEAEHLGHDVASEVRNGRAAKVQGMWERIKESRHKPEVPESLCCSITFELMKDPVITPGGQTYDRSSIEWHIRQNGSWDPVTRQPFEMSQLRPNIAMKEVIRSFLEQNPWAYEG